VKRSNGAQGYYEGAKLGTYVNPSSGVKGFHAFERGEVLRVVGATICDEQQFSLDVQMLERRLLANDAASVAAIGRPQFVFLKEEFVEGSLISASKAVTRANMLVFFTCLSKRGVDEKN
jgi:hypothetical protein